MDMAEQAAFLGRTEDRCPPELDRPPDVVQERRREEQIDSQALVELGRLPTERRDSHRVLEQATGVSVMAFGRGRQRPEPGSYGLVGEETPNRRPQARVRDLSGEKLEEPVQLVGVPAQPGRKRGRVGVLRGLERPDLELEPVAVALHSTQHANRVALLEASVQKLDVIPDPSLDPAARIDELEREIRRARAGSQPLLAGNCVDALDHPVLGESDDRGHVASLAAVADVRPFPSMRYDEAKASPLETLVAPPYDVISPAEREHYLALSPYNVVHLTLPDSEEQAARDLHQWQSDGILARDEKPAAWALSQTYTGPDG